MAGTVGAKNEAGIGTPGQQFRVAIHRKYIGRLTTMNRWMKRRIERSRARCERATGRPQINTDVADKKTSAATPMLSKDKRDLSSRNTDR